MSEFPNRRSHPLQAEPSQPLNAAKAVLNETARDAASVPLSVGPFAVLPTQFGRYRIEKLLGKGAMGAVYLAHDLQLDRPMALKVARISTARSAKLINRMETEVKAVAKIDHPGVILPVDFGEIDGIGFVALRYVEGEDLMTYLRRVGHRREPMEAISLTIQIARVLQAAHGQGVLHRNLSPENVILSHRGGVAIMGFGFATPPRPQGMILGTAAYMSPEQAMGKSDEIDKRSDLYAVGLILFEILTGELPFNGSAIEVMGWKCVQDAPSPLSINPSLPPQLAAVSHKLIARKKEDRYSDCAELIAALQDC